MLELTSVNPDGSASFNSMYRWRQNLVFLIRPYIGTRMSARPINAPRISCSERNVEQYTKTYTRACTYVFVETLMSFLRALHWNVIHEKLNFVTMYRNWKERTVKLTKFYIFVSVNSERKKLQVWIYMINPRESVKIVKSVIHREDL